MNQSCWYIRDNRGFLLHPDPLTTLAGTGILPDEAREQIEAVGRALPELLESRRLRPTLERLPLFDLAAIDADDCRVVERLMQLYSYFASAYVWATHEKAAQRIPAGVAVPLVQLGKHVERPPILSYANYVLTNWERRDPQGPIALENLKLIQNFLGDRDEDWFILVHVDIEARAAAALAHIPPAMEAVVQGDAARLEAALEAIAESIAAMITAFQRMPEHCDPERYHLRVRPYIFGFNDVVYEGVAEYGGRPQSFRGQTGAQSSIVPALVSAFGLEHEQTGLTQHLRVMKDYMPRPHRDFLAQTVGSTIRAYVEKSGTAALKARYNECLRQLTRFRRLHLHYATTYIFEKVESPLGTGGTMYMDWLGQLIDETERQLV